MEASASTPISNPPSTTATANSSTASNNAGNTVINFGKHKGKTYAWVFENEYSYYEWASEQRTHGALRAFVEYCRKRELDDVAPVAPEDADVDTAAAALVRRAGIAVNVRDVEAANQRAMKRHREDMADARFQMECKYSAYGYDSPAEFRENEHEIMEFMQQEPDLKPAVIKQPQNAPVEDKMMQIARAMLEVHRSTDPKEERSFDGLDNEARKQIHTMAEGFPDLFVCTRDRRSASTGKKKKGRGYGKSIATMVIQKKRVNNP